MKKMIIAAIVILFAKNATAQTGAPKELTCTERAFNFSVSLGSKLMLGAPKMGPAEIANDDAAYIPGWWFKAKHAKPETTILPSYETALKNGNPDVSGRQSHVQSHSVYSLKTEDKIKHLFPARSLPGVY